MIGGPEEGSKKRGTKLDQGHKWAHHLLFHSQIGSWDSWVRSRHDRHSVIQKPPFRDAPKGNLCLLELPAALLDLGIVSLPESVCAKPCDVATNWSSVMEVAMVQSKTVYDFDEAAFQQKLKSLNKNSK